jgi:AraC-like DNA-binding protein
MDVAARLSDSLLTQLRIALTGDHSVLAVQGWDHLGTVLRERMVDVVVLEPSPLAPAELPALLALLAGHPATPVVIYTSITAPAMQATVELARRSGVRHVIFRGVDDAPSRLRALLLEIAGDPWHSALLPWVVSRVARTPGGVERAVGQLFRAPQQFHDVADLARAAGMTRRTVERWLTRAGIASAKRLVVSARVERGHHLLRESRADVGEVARRLGYPSARLFARQVHLAIGRPPSMLRHAVTGDELVAQLVSWLTTTPDDRTVWSQPQGELPTLHIA